MCNFKSDINKLVDILQKSKDHRNAFNAKYNEHIHALMHRYDKVTGGYTQRGKSGILAFGDGVFKVIHYGYEADWYEEYPIKLLTDSTFIELLEEKHRESIAKERQAREERELEQLAKLKSKYES